jgi:hypothetical protein
VLAQGGGDLLGELLDLLDQWLDRGDQSEHERPPGGELGLANASLGRASELREQLGGLLTSGVAPAREERPEAAVRPPRAPRGARVARQERSEIGLSSFWNTPIGPGQNRSSSARNWLHNATLACTRSSRARVSARSAFVSPESGSSTRKR